MMKIREIRELLDTKIFWRDKWLEGKCWETAGQIQREIDILMMILGIEEESSQKHKEVKK